MEKPSKPKCNILACLPKAASPVTFQLSPPHSPVKPPAARKGLTGPIISIIPKEARRKPKNESFEAREPTSPKVSCMGQVKNKKKKSMSKPKQVVLPVQVTTAIPSPKESKKKPSSTINVLKGKRRGDKVDVIDDHKAGIAERVPSLGQAKQYTSSRGMLANFDWRACEDEEKGKGKEKAIIVDGQVAGEPRKEVNLWKRRNQDPPIPLQV